MYQKISLDVRQIQKLSLTPELLQSIELLTLNTLDLRVVVNELAISNPLIDINHNDSSSDSDQDTREKLLSEMKKYDYSNYSPEDAQDDDGDSPLNYYQEHEGLIDDLNFQYRSKPRSEKDLNIATYIFHNLDSSGYLELGLEKIAEDTGYPYEDVLRVKEEINRLEPLGIAATSLKECLSMQCTKDGLCKDIIHFHLEDIADNKLDKIAKERGVSMDEVKERVAYIKSLNPRPAASYANNSPISYIVPEAHIYKEDDLYHVYMEKDFVPKIHISQTYKNMIKKAEGETLKYLSKQFSSAQWLISSINQRENTIKKILEELVRIQKDFLDDGKEKMKPLSQKDLAKRLDISESTVSTLR